MKQCSFCLNKAVKYCETCDQYYCYRCSEDCQVMCPECSTEYKELKGATQIKEQERIKNKK